MQLCKFAMWAAGSKTQNYTKQRLFSLHCLCWPSYRVSPICLHLTYSLLNSSSPYISIQMSFKRCNCINFYSVHFIHAPQDFLHLNKLPLSFLCSNEKPNKKCQPIRPLPLTQAHQLRWNHCESLQYLFQLNDILSITEWPELRTARQEWSHYCTVASWCPNVCTQYTSKMKGNMPNAFFTTGSTWFTTFREP